MSTLVFPLVGYAVTGSARQAGLVGAVTALSQLFGGLPAGALVDRWSRRRVLLWFNMLGAACFGILAWVCFAGLLTLWLLLVAAGVAGVVEVFLTPALSASVKEVVPPCQRTTASAYSSGRALTASLVGPPLGGALLGLGRAIPFFVDAVTYAAAFVSVLFVRAPLDAPAAERKYLLREIGDGISYLWRESILRGFMLWGAIFNLGATMVFLAVVLHLASHHVPAGQIGMVESISALGGIVGSFVAPKLVDRVPTGRMVVTTGLTIAGLFGVAGLFTSPWPMGALMALAMFFMPACNAGIGGYFSHVVPRHLQGRVQGARGFIARSLKPLGPVLVGILLPSVGGGATIGIGSIILACSIVPVLCTPAIRRLPVPRIWRDADG